VVDLLRRGRTDEPTKELHGMNNVVQGGHIRTKVTIIKEAPLIEQGDREECAQSVNGMLIVVQVA
jgi:hypothetical protein